MKAYYTKDEIVNDQFIFISYKHEDNGTVNEVLEYLYEYGVRFWYDADLGVGQQWTAVAKELILHDNCTGVIFFNSVDSFISEPVNKERSYALEKQEKCKKTGKPFFVFPVNMGYPSVLELIRAVFFKYEDLDELKQKYHLEYIRNITNLFASDIIYCYADPDSKEEYMKKLAENIGQTLPNVVDKDAQALKRIESEMSSESGEKILFGVSKDKPTDLVPPALLGKDGCVHLRNGSYIVQNGKSYTVKKIAWRLLYCQQDEYVMVSENVVDLRNGGKELKEWLATQFFPLAFTEEERSQIKQLRLITTEDIQLTVAKEKLVFEQNGDNPEGHWWMENMAQGALQKVVKKDGKVFETGYNMRTKKSGIRPVIVVGKDELTGIRKRNQY